MTTRPVPTGLGLSAPDVSAPAESESRASDDVVGEDIQVGTAFDLDLTGGTSVVVVFSLLAALAGLVAAFATPSLVRGVAAVLAVLAGVAVIRHVFSARR